MQMTDKELDTAIAAKVYPKITVKSINDRIATVRFFVIPGTTTTLCYITMVNGFNFIGQSACVDERNFDLSIGQEIAERDALAKIWSYEGYLLAELYYQGSVRNGDVRAP